MAKDVITIDGEQTVVREDTAKAYRGVHWAMTSIAIMVLIMIILFFAFFWRSARDGQLESPVTNPHSGP